MANAVKHFPDNCDARQNEGGACFCNFGMLNGYPGPWRFRWFGDLLSAPFQRFNGEILCQWLDTTNVNGSQGDCIWAWSDEVVPGRFASISLIWSNIDPALSPPNTALFKAIIREPITTMPTGDWTAESDPIQFVFPDPSLEPATSFGLPNGNTPKPGAVITCTPRKWDWVP